ncbi:bifunctional DNA-formamidopyrimidine glycosylase/DNA-(apurinic or apyrimidinic site) lyase [Desulfurispirillum indicum]|uniref:Formamidopyrimidine-DNA glycosylase n=1 Tax=Desulfurispirillum indicum (strain ATCC BAA-1389 / DSM 22839 / S5) TaxID=653733 RepID=E6W4G9_DESIS|nr:bifunctional DNA-formamidopyrimidine glycosylase/DNA-(apurinic or apyrimidinic site) lyase [Desulfurispirillum indicum]ADU65943.1 formamidopyrimidine-DNA glycosylase [Desulfurispirillum indicum S5]UCZ57877.1 bifunctional DNA-formamidopyrimidine glycosylase/DNA-(apurinic or apyrimidinic site) lyase [Desulfurispirillum indicum]
MPELPEVQTLVDDLCHRALVGQTISDVQVTWPRSIASHTPADFRHQLTGQTLTAIRRRAKYLVMELSSGWGLLVHLRMTGKFDLCDPVKPRDIHEHVILCLGSGQELRFHDTRKFGRFSLVPDTVGALSHLGVEPLSPEFTPEVLGRLLAGRNTMLKSFLLDQTKVAGIGNIYADEALFEARLHPANPCRLVAAEQVASLHGAIIMVLQRGLRNMGTSLGTSKGNFYSVAGRPGRNEDELKVFRRTGTPCCACGTTIERIILIQRSTHFCPLCQPLLA